MRGSSQQGDRKPTEKRAKDGIEKLGKGIVAWN